jgi:RimJ/RimL family protein N-acetyltransferase
MRAMHLQFARADVPAGTGWARYADLLVQDHTGPVVALDLSGEPLRFQTDPAHRLAVRPMTEGDLREVSRWVSAPHVARWWDEHRSPEQVAAYYGPAIRGEEPTRLWVWEVNGRSVGFSQDYLIADHPGYALLCGHPEAVGFDYALGEAAYVGRGLGTALLWTFLRDIVVPAYPGVAELFAAPDHRNLGSRRVLAKVGAVEDLWFDEPASLDGPAGTVVGCSIDVARVIGRRVTEQ